MTKVIKKESVASLIKENKLLKEENLRLKKEVKQREEGLKKSVNFLARNIAKNLEKNKKIKPSDLEKFTKRLEELLGTQKSP